MLSYYAERLPAVEINNTFYRLPKPAVLEQWSTQVPAGFVFALKASRRITHFKRLKDAGDPLRFMLDTSQALGDARGPILFQLPPNMKLDIDRLREFLGLLSDDIRAAFEFRHASWHDDEVYQALRDHGAALCVADSDEDTTPVQATTDWGYLRLRRPEYSEPDLSAWAGRVHAQAWKHAFVFFKHEDAGTGPRLAKRFEAVFNSI